MYVYVKKVIFNMCWRAEEILDIGAKCERKNSYFIIQGTDK